MNSEPWELVVAALAAICAISATLWWLLRRKASSVVALQASTSNPHNKPTQSVENGQVKSRDREEQQTHRSPSAPPLSSFRIFVSYRRKDSADVTGRICDRLTAEFGDEAVFTDVDSIPLGVDFRSYIREAVDECDVLIAIVGPQWLGVHQMQRDRRIDNDSDFIRLELEAALARKIPIIPVLVHSAQLPSADVLPQSISAFAYYNGLPIRPNPDFSNDVARLVAGLRQSRDNLGSK